MGSGHRWGTGPLAMEATDSVLFMFGSRSAPPTPFNRQSTFDFRFFSRTLEAGSCTHRLLQFSPRAPFSIHALAYRYTVLQPPQAASPRPSGIDASLFPGRPTSPCAACKDLSLGTSSPSCHSTPSLFHHFPISHFSSSHLRFHHAPFMNSPSLALMLA